MRSNVWAAPNARAAWMAGGTYLVARKIRIRIEQWDRTGHRRAGAVRRPRQGFRRAARRHQGARDGRARSTLDIASHIRLANPRTGADSERERILRRGYNFAEGIDEIGQMGAGLFFLGFQQDPRRQFVSIQTRLAANDLLNEYLFHTGSAIFAIPPGVQPRRLDRRHALRLTHAVA